MIAFAKSQIIGQYYRILRHSPLKNKNITQKKYGNKDILSTEEGRSILIDAIKKGEPFMAARFGTSEGQAVNEYLLQKKNPFHKHYSDFLLNQMCCNAGFFPNDVNLLKKFCENEIKSCENLDLLGVMHFIGEDYIVEKYCKNAALMPCGGLASASKGWAHALEGKKVLVIHPFEESIRFQYLNNREKIFPGTNALPEFELHTLKAVQTIADETDDRFANWFEALHWMLEECKKIDFDIALIGCGAYGFQLASAIKDMGKIAIHMGGSLQTLFGIKGSRWDVKNSSMYNDSWIYPLESEKPKGYMKVENGCYWNNN